MRNNRKMIYILLMLIVCVTAWAFSIRTGGKGLAQNAINKTTEEQRIPVVTTPVRIRKFEERLNVHGTLEAKHFAVVSARTPGAIENIFVDEGDRVVAGKTRLFQIDALKLKRNVEKEAQEVSVTKYARIEAEANLERVQADFHKAEIDYERFKRLFQKKAVTAEAMEGQESRYKQTEAQLRYARTSVDLAGEKEKKAEAALAIAEKDLRDALVYAPITGRISRKIREIGEMAQPGQPVLRIEDPSVIEVSAYLPAEYYDRIIPEETPMYIKVYGDELRDRTVTYKSPTIHPQLRTFEVKCLIKDPPENFVPGALAEVAILLERRDGLGVPTDAVQIRGERSVIFTVQDQTARMIEVNTGLETDGWTEIRDSKLPENTPIVTMGQFLLNDGAAVRIQRGEG
ncbi:efflux RND transporter periplasmic adaptor subunit [bacterium]|nr:efflux RND transporter periplasmic adaptor subunit [bacterium]